MRTVTEHFKGWPRRMAWAALAAGMALPLAAAAQQAIASGSLNLRAGPGTGYPVVARLAPGQPLDVIGCTAGYGWCDVVLPDGLRGWVAASYLAYPYQGATVPLVRYGAVIGVPVVTFAIGAYWGNYYRDRPWYAEPRWWGGRPPPPRAPGWRPAPPLVPAWQPHPPPPDWRPPPPPRAHPPRPMGPPPGMHPPPGVRAAGPSGVRPLPPSGVRMPGPPSELRAPPSKGVRVPPPRGPRPPRDPGIRPPGGGGMPSGGMPR